HDVVRHAVVVEEGKRFALLDGDAFDGKRAALLVDDFGGGECAGRKARSDHDRKQSQLAHGKSWCWQRSNQRGKTGTLVGLRSLGSVCRTATTWAFSCAVRPSGFTRSDRLGRSTPP